MFCLYSQVIIKFGNNFFLTIEERVIDIAGLLRKLLDSLVVAYNIGFITQSELLYYGDDKLTVTFCLYDFFLNIIKIVFNAVNLAELRLDEVKVLFYSFYSLNKFILLAKEGTSL